ncbi:MAG TPA: F0F1 ATP synthase subunit A [Candidatus Omnitrophota bacterium]|nr:F0F1 ATP synthase subunit A [Candidatus Omnitrophota bacterium]
MKSKFYLLLFCLIPNMAFAAEAGGEETALEAPNAITLLYHYFPHQPAVEFLHHWENIFFSALVAVLIGATGFIAAKRSALVPCGIQNLFEFAVEGLDNFICGILGKNGRQFTPFIGTLFIYIFLMNVAGIIPGLKSPTSSFGITFPLGLVVFFYVQYTGIRKLGLLKYLGHLSGDPQNFIGFLLVPLMLFLHVVGELVKPLSLSLRLFGNIWGEDVLISVFVGMGGRFFIPIHVPFLFLALLTSFVQATVFCLLATIYISLMLPHEEEHHEEDARKIKLG